MKKNQKEFLETLEKFLKESNAIEGEYSAIAFNDALDAWKYASFGNKTMTTKYILKIHYELMKNYHHLTNVDEHLYHFLYHVLPIYYDLFLY